MGQCLGTPEEKIFRGSVKELAAGRFNSLSVLLVEAAEVLPRRAPGLPDEAFERGDVPMTKQEVRAAVLAKLAVRPEDILWDVGAGTGSVSVELALAAPRGRVYAVECRPEGCALIKANREKFRTRNLVLVEGLAPAALSDLPAPDAVFIGGSKGSLAAIVDAALDKNPDARICVSAIALETPFGGGGRADGQRPDRAGEPDRRQPGQGRGRAASHDGPEPHLPHHRRMT